MSFDPTMPAIEFTPAGETAELREANLELVEPSPGFDSLANLCVDIITKDSDTTVLDYTAQQVSLRFHIDGIWHPGPVMDRESGDFMLATLKQMAGLNFRERRQRQEGKFKSIYQKKGQTFKIVTQGVRTGERVAIYMDYKRPPMESAVDFGMRAKMQEQIAELVSEKREMGNVLVVGVPGGGYTSVWKAVLSCADRLTRDYYVLQPKGRGDDEDVINVMPVEYDPQKGEDPLSPMEALLLKQPDVLAFPDLDNADWINRITELSVRESLPIFTRHPGKHCLDGLLRVIAKGPNVKAFVDRLDAVISMRIIRKLCQTCRVAFQPHPQLMQQLGLPPGRVSELYQPFVFKPGMLDENEQEILPCAKCAGIGFRGQTGIFELLKLDDELRKAIVQKPRMDHLKAIAKQRGHVSMQMEGILMIAKGETSVDELQRVLKA